MRDANARKRLKRKVLDRWENEGGRICTDSTKADESSPTNDHDSDDNQLPASHDNSTVNTPPPTPGKRIRNKK